jgi:hypothetical protein
VSLLMLGSSFAGRSPDPVDSPTLSLSLALSVIYRDSTTCTAREK